MFDFFKKRVEEPDTVDLEEMDEMFCTMGVIEPPCPYRETPESIVNIDGAQPVEAWLNCVKGKNEGASYGLFDGAVFGRAPESDICVPDIHVSRKHCVFHRRYYWEVKVFGMNGVYVNERLVKAGETVSLDAGDKLTFEDWQFIFGTSLINYF